MANMHLSLYFLSQDKNDGCGTYDSCIVAAETEEEARCIHPDISIIDVAEWDVRFPTWATNPSQVKVELIGLAIDPNLKKGVILASFNDG